MKSLPIHTLKFLPPRREFEFAEDQKYWSKILDMCTSPTKSKGFSVVITKDINDRGCSIKAGAKGVVRPFNPIDFKIISNDYENAISWGLYCKRTKHELPDLTRCYDFFMESKKGGLTMAHIHISKNEFDFTNNQLLIFNS